jgi:hypothetical protein
MSGGAPSSWVLARVSRSLGIPAKYAPRSPRSRIPRTSRGTDRRASKSIRRVSCSASVARVSFARAVSRSPLNSAAATTDPAASTTRDRTATTDAAAYPGFRLIHLAARSSRPAGRARIGSPRSQRSSSSANSAAER